MGHDAPYAGHMASKSTRQRIRMSFWFPDMENRVHTYCESCKVCQLRAHHKIWDRVLIIPIPRGDEFPFSHLVMDCIGPIVPRGDPVAIQPKYNYALVVIDLFSRWAVAYLLRSMSAQAVCNILLQIFMTFSIPRVISSDCGTNFTSKLTRFLLEYLGRSPRFHTSSEVSGVVERYNQGLSSVICKLVEERPQRWYGLLLIVW